LLTKIEDAMIKVDYSPIYYYHYYLQYQLIHSRELHNVAKVWGFRSMCRREILGE